MENVRPPDRLAASLFINCADPGARLMGMFTAYFDASGTPHEQFVVVSGYIANYYQWQLIEQMWKSIHQQYDVRPPFHMVEFMAATSNPQYGVQKNARRDCVEIAKDTNKARAFLGNLSAAQITVVNCGISCVVPMAVYNGVSSLLDLKKVIPPYALAARMCIARVHEWERQFAVEEPVECIFEAGDFEQGKFTDLMVTEGLGAPTYKNKEDYAGLQAADHYAWEQSYFLKKHLFDENFPARGVLELLLHSIPKLHIQPTTESLVDLCRRKGIDPLTGVKM